MSEEVRAVCFRSTESALAWVSHPPWSQHIPLRWSVTGPLGVRVLGAFDSRCLSGNKRNNCALPAQMEQSPPFRVDATLTGREPHDRPKPQSSWWSRRTRNQKAAGASIAVLAAIGLATSGGGSDSTQVAGRSLERSATNSASAHRTPGNGPAGRRPRAVRQLQRSSRCRSGTSARRNSRLRTAPGPGRRWRCL